MSDNLHRFLLENLHVRGERVKLDSAWKDIQHTAEYPEPIKQVLGEALAAMSLLAASLKFEGSLVLQMDNTHPVTMFVVQANSKGALRAIARWEDDIPADASYNDLFGTGVLVISLEPEGEGDRYQSRVSLHGESLAETLREYFQQSEQLHTQLWLSANDEHASGLMLQSLPTEDSDNEGWNHALTLANTVTKEEMLELDATTLLHRLYHEEDLRLYEPKALRFECSCSQEKVENMVISLGHKEAVSIIEDEGNISVDCQFCNSHYELDTMDVDRLFSSSNPSSGSVH